MVLHLTFKPTVVGSIPTRPTTSGSGERHFRQLPLLCFSGVDSQSDSQSMMVLS